jgi:hypothetical protein
MNATLKRIGEKCRKAKEEIDSGIYDRMYTVKRKKTSKKSWRWYDDKKPEKSTSSRL